MTRIVIPKEQLPNISNDLTNKLRYRIINKNRNLFSQWSVIGEIKRDIDPTDFESNATSFTTDSSISDRIDVTWYTGNINQDFDVYTRYKLTYFDATYGTFYRNEPLRYLGRKNTNYLTINKLPLSNLGSIYTVDNYAVQTMVKLPEYPRLFSLPVNIEEFDRKADKLRYWAERDIKFSAGDYVDISLNNNNTASPFEDNSLWTGIKKVYSVGDNGPESFSVELAGADIPLRQVLDLGPGYPNTVSKINGSVQFVTDDILFT
jgi:hypothetical protein